MFKMMEAENFSLLRDVILIKITTEVKELVRDKGKDVVSLSFGTASPQIMA